MDKGAKIIIVILVIIACAIFVPFLLTRLFHLIGDKLRKPAIVKVGDGIRKVSLIDFVLDRRANGKLFGAGSIDPSLQSLGATSAMYSPQPISGGARSTHDITFSDKMEF